MKIFISHASKDKWAARRISKDLENIGMQTFLDEKDIKTGESIDLKIQEHLKDCDDVMIIVSPASVNSQWVLIELGGALALQKNIIPILLYVGVNDIPNAINKLLGRDINEVEKYYAELIAKQTNSQPITPPVPPKVKTPKLIEFKVGDTVQLPKKRQSEKEPPGWDDDMDKFLGLQSKIVSIDDDLGYIRVEIDGTEWAWDKNWLVKIE